jgi:hypothetical protein
VPITDWPTPEPTNLGITDWPTTTPTISSITAPPVQMVSSPLQNALQNLIQSVFDTNTASRAFPLSMCWYLILVHR